MPHESNAPWGGIVSQASFKTENTPARTPPAAARARATWWACNLILVYRETVGSAPINNSCYFRKSVMISDKDSHLFGWLSFFEMDARRADKLLHERLVRL